MATRITDNLMTSDATTHWAEFDPHRAADGNGGWVVSWLPTRILTRNQAITAMTLAEFLAEGIAPGHRLWPHVESFAAELGLSAERAAQLAAEEDAEKIDHEDQLQRMLDAYDLLIGKRFVSEPGINMPWHVQDEIRRTVRQAIEQAWDAGHACARQNDL